MADLKPSAAWQAFSGKVTLSPGTAHAYLHVVVKGEGTVHLDDVAIAAQDQPGFDPAADQRAIGTAPSNYAGRTPYAWDQVFIGAGGTPTVFAQNPAHPDVIYAGMDVGGPMRRDVQKQRWFPLADTWGPDNLAHYHTECLAVDPNNPNAVYYSAGKEWSTGRPSILRSGDRGRTWQAVPLTDAAGKDVFITNGRTGKRLSVDPHDGRILFYGSRREGLFQSTDAGKSWQQTTGFPIKGTSVDFVLFDAASGKAGAPTPVLYAAVHPASPDAAGAPAGVYRSRDAGRTWQRLDGAPAPVATGEMDEQGALYVTGAGVWRFRNEQWQEITPKTPKNKRGYFALAVSPADPNLIAVAQDHCGGSNGLFRTADGGQTWAALDTQGLFRSSDGGQTWVNLDGVERAWRFGWGRPAVGSKTPVAFLLGRVRGSGVKEVALYRSDDLGKTWARIDDDCPGWGQASVITGDRQTPGRVYVGTNGRGIFYGDSVNQNSRH